MVDAAAEAERLGGAKAMNVLLLGATIKLMGLESLDWEKIIRENVKPQFVELNLRALAFGQTLVG